MGRAELAEIFFDSPELDLTEQAEPVQSSEDVPLEDETQEYPKWRKVEPKDEVQEENVERLPKDEKELEGERVAGEDDEEDEEKSALNRNVSSLGGENGGVNGVDSGLVTLALTRTSNSKKSSKMKSGNNVWLTKSTRKGKKKSKATDNSNHNNGTNSGYSFVVEEGRNTEHQGTPRASRHEILILTDLEADYINMYAATSQINRLIRGFLCVLLLLMGPWFMFLVSFLITCYHVMLVAMAIFQSFLDDDDDFHSF